MKETIRHPLETPHTGLISKSTQPLDGNQRLVLYHAKRDALAKGERNATSNRKG